MPVTRWANDWVEQLRLPFHSLYPGANGKGWKIEYLRSVLRRDGKFRNPLIVTRNGPMFRVIVGSNRLLALQGEGMLDDIDVLLVGDIDGMIRAFSEYYLPKIALEDVVPYLSSSKMD
jgi:hypothetical protein